MAIDRIDWHYDSAAEIYSRETGKTALFDAKAGRNELSDEDNGIICRRAGNHIGLFITWLAKNDLLETEEGDPDAAEKVKNEEMLGVDYLLDCTDGKFWDSDIKDCALEEVKDIYDAYLDLYVGWMRSNQYKVVSSWDGYHELEKLLDKKFGRRIERIKRKAQ